MTPLTNLKSLSIADQRFSLYSDSQSFILGTTDKLVATTTTLKFAGASLSPGIRFSSIGKKLLNENNARLVARDKNHYVIAGIITDFKLLEDQTVTMVIFSAIDEIGNDALQSFARANNFAAAYFGFALLEGNLAYIDIDGQTNIVQPEITLIEQSISIAQ